jgi:hypothetical protein
MSADEPTRERVRATIGLVGGYWRPLAAVARLLEELGELAELLGPSTPDAGQCVSELADLWIIATAVSDQFLGAVAEPGSPAPRPPEDDAERASRDGQALSRGLPARLLAAGGRIARIVNYYDGPKTPRAFDGWVSLSDAVAEFHRALADVAHAHEVDLGAAVSAKLDAIPTLDSGRFRAGEHDPSTAASLERFRTVHAEPTDPVSEPARLWGSPMWSPESFTSNVQAFVADLIPFTKAAPWERLDGYVIRGPEFASMALLDDWLMRLLDGIAARDPAVAYLATAPVDRGLRGSERRLTFNGLRLHVLVRSPLYDVRDPRHFPVGTFALLRVEHPPDRHAAQ